MLHPLLRYSLIGLLLLSCGAGAQTLEIIQPWVRAMPPGQPMTAAYLQIENTGASTQTIYGATASLAGSVEIHTTIEEAGMLRMRQLTDINLAPGERMELKPGGAHLMLFKLTHSPQLGESVQLCLLLQDADKVCSEATVLKAGPTAAHSHH